MKSELKTTVNNFNRDIRNSIKKSMTELEKRLFFINADTILMFYCKSVGLTDSDPVTIVIELHVSWDTIQNDIVNENETVYDYVSEDTVKIIKNVFENVYDVDIEFEGYKSHRSSMIFRDEKRVEKNNII